MNPTIFEFVCALLFCCAAVAIGAGFLVGRWYERTVNETAPWRPSFVPERAHPERVVPFPVTRRRPLALVDPSPSTDPAA